MNDREGYLHYLLDVAGAPHGELPVRAAGRWDDILDLAEKNYILLPVAGMLASRWNDLLPETVREDIRKLLEVNIARNTLLEHEIRFLAGLFGSAGIPAIFIKGSACLVRGMFPEGWRYLSDLDIQVPAGRLTEAFSLLNAHGFHARKEGIEQAHHREPLYSGTHPGAVELHSYPYSLGATDGGIMSGIWDDAETVPFHGVPVTIPSLTDHMWISLRADAVRRIEIPGLSSLIEYGFMGERVRGIDFGLLHARASKEGMPNLVHAFSCACREFGYYFPAAEYAGCDMEAWREWSVRLRRKALRGEFCMSSRKRCAAALFLPGNKIGERIRFFFWMHRELSLADRFDPGPYRKKTRFQGIILFMKLAATSILAGAEYAAFRIAGMMRGKGKRPRTTGADN